MQVGPVVRVLLPRVVPPNRVLLHLGSKVGRCHVGADGAIVHLLVLPQHPHAPPHKRRAIDLAPRLLPVAPRRLEVQLVVVDVAKECLVAVEPVRLQVGRVHTADVLIVQELLHILLKDPPRVRREPQPAQARLGVPPQSLPQHLDLPGVQGEVVLLLGAVLQQIPQLQQPRPQLRLQHLVRVHKLLVEAGRQDLEVGQARLQHVKLLLQPVDALLARLVAALGKVCPREEADDFDQDGKCPFDGEGGGLRVGDNVAAQLRDVLLARLALPLAVHLTPRRLQAVEEAVLHKLLKRILVLAKGREEGCNQHIHGARRHLFALHHHVNRGEEPVQLRRVKHGRHKLKRSLQLVCSDALQRQEGRRGAVVL
mmetsp:Transcript_35964/g.90595  ORF Transcript_35964/g.90595 Transcript_35964/m.90595 type:complete len:368 (-) Transcript_35964:497-1600(-)